jgi:hypothetical protein
MKKSTVCFLLWIPVNEHFYEAAFVIGHSMVKHLSMSHVDGATQVIHAIS